MSSAARFWQSPTARIGALTVGALVLFALVGPVVAPDPDVSDFALAPSATGPSASHWLGVDPLLRDVLSRLAHGARLSLGIATLATVLATAVGAIVGLVAGLSAGPRAFTADAVLMRAVDIVLATPFLLLVTAIGAAVGRAEIGTILLVLGLTGWTGVARIVRDRTIVLRHLQFVEASRALGGSVARIAIRHLVPNLLPTLLVLATTAIGQMILAEAVLGYLTVGVQPPTATWGRMLHEAEPFLTTRPALLAAPGLAIVLSVVGFSRLGDGVRDALEPKAAPPAAGRVPVDLLVALASLLLLTGAGPGRLEPPIGQVRTEAVPRRGGTLHVATLVNLRTLEPAIAYDEVSTSIENLVFARLVTWDRSGLIVPDLAEYRVEESGTTVVFELRSGATFHDGAAVTAADVKRSVERTLAKTTPCPAASHYAMIAGFSEFHTGKAAELAGVRVLGERTIAFDLEHPDATFLPLMTLAFVAPVCPSSGARVDPRSQAKPCGAGPMRVASYEPDRGVTLVRHEGYFDPSRPFLDGIEWSTHVKASTQRFKFETGDLDVLRDVSASDGVLFRKDPAWKGQWSWAPKLATYGVFLNTEMAPFDRPLVRRAVSLALDPSVLQRTRGDLVAVDRMLPDAMPGRPPIARGRTHDLPAALEAMARSGFPFDPPTGRGGYPDPIDYLAVTESFDQQSAEIWQQQLANIGLRVRLRLVTFATFLAETQRRKTARMGATGWNADFPDPANFFEPILGTGALQDEGSENVAFFSNGELDRVLDSAHRSTDPAERAAAYARAEEIVRDEAPWIPTYSSQTLEVWQPYVRGYAPHPLLAQHYTDVWIDPDARRPAPLGPGLGAGREAR